MCRKFDDLERAARKNQRNISPNPDILTRQVFCYVSSMDRIDSRAGLPFNGRREMQELALMAQDALEKGGLREEVHTLRERVLERPPTDLMDRLDDDDGGGGGGERWQMKPVVELLLREIRAVALHARPIDERRHDIKWLLDTAGF
jgi:hypothetical protein